MPVANFAALIENFEVKKTKHFTLLNTGYFYYYLTVGGGVIIPPLNPPQKSGFKYKSWLDPKIQSIIRQQKKMGSIRPKLGPYRRNQNLAKNVDF